MQDALSEPVSSASGHKSRRLHRLVFIVASETESVYCSVVILGAKSVRARTLASSAMMHKDAVRLANEVAIIDVALERQGDGSGPDQRESVVYGRQ